MPAIFPAMSDSRRCLAQVGAGVGRFSPSNLSVTPDLAVAASGGVLVGGADGFYATVAGELDTAAGTALLSIRHPGGWSPMAGLMSPAFDGTVAFGVGGK